MDVVQLFEGQLFFLYFLLDVVDVFWVVIDFGVDVLSGQFVCECFFDIFYIVFVCYVGFIYFVGDVVVGFWFQMVECEVFQFLF